MAHEVTLIPGDGTGPELVEATGRVPEAADKLEAAIAAVIKQGEIEEMN